MDSWGSTMSKVNVHAKFNQYYVQFQDTIKIYADYSVYTTPACLMRHSAK